MKQVITDIAHGEVDLDTLKAGASLIPAGKVIKLPKVIKAIGNVGKTGSKKGKEGEKISKSSQAKQTKVRDKGGSKTLESTQWSGDKEVYSVAYEVKLPDNMYPGMSDARHFQEANKQLHAAFNADAEFAQEMEALYPGIIEGVQPGKRGAYPRKSPTKDVTWHHEVRRKGILQLMPIEQHTAKGKIQSALHPQGRGGMEIWGGERKRKK